VFDGTYTHILGKLVVLYCKHHLTQKPDVFSDIGIALALVCVAAWFDYNHCPVTHTQSPGTTEYGTGYDYYYAFHTWFLMDSSKSGIYTGRSESICVPDDYSIKNTHTIDDLKMVITEYTWNADRAILNTVFENTVRRVNKCLENGGGHFEHYV
jgi:hypothetical protein